MLTHTARTFPASRPKTAAKFAQRIRDEFGWDCRIDSNEDGRLEVILIGAREDAKPFPVSPTFGRRRKAAAVAGRFEALGFRTTVLEDEAIDFGDLSNGLVPCFRAAICG